MQIELAPQTLKFPSVTTRLASGRPSGDYQTLGTAFTDPAGNCTMALDSYFGQAAVARIVAKGEISFHLMGDSGVGGANQENVAEAMARDVDPNNHEDGPSFLVHLGDIMYGPNKEAGYSDKFYRIYDHYDRLVFAVPGNHDGETKPVTDPQTLSAFLENFCASVGTQPPEGQKYGMLMPNQPGPYWHLQAPFVDIVGIYTNTDENAGILANNVVGQKQKAWLLGRLQAIALDRANGIRKALVFVMHHPPYARGFHESGYGHPGSPEMLQDLDDCCKTAGLLPDAVVAGHTHSEQLYIRTQSLGNAAPCKIPYLICGTGGISLQPLPSPIGIKDPTGHVLYARGNKDFGYLTATASAAELVFTFTAVVGTHRELRDRITVNLATQSLV